MEQLTELVTYLAMNPQGVHPNVLAGVLWPRGVTPDVSDAAVERARTWLGDDVHGHPYLLQDADGRLALSEAVVCDWDAVRSLFLRARTASSRRDEVELLRRGLQLIRGESFTGAPEGRYSWVAHERPRTHHPPGRGRLRAPARGAARWRRRPGRRGWRCGGGPATRPGQPAAVA